MTLEINFVGDVAARCSERLKEAGYSPDPADDRVAIYTYVSVRHRRVRPRPRTVHKASYKVPAHLAEGERQLLAKVVAGDDLWPHQSRKILKLSVNDGMLDDYGIQHFHLGTKPDRKRPHLIEGTKELLFAAVKEDDFHVIGIYDHNNWSTQSLLDIVHATWPHLTAPYTLKGGPGFEVIGLRHQYTDEQTAELRAAGINVLQQRPDGSVQVGMGGGVALDGSSSSVRRSTNSLIATVENLQKEVVSLILEENDGRLPSGATIRLTWDANGVYAVSEPPIVKVVVGDRLDIPPL